MHGAIKSAAKVLLMFPLAIGALSVPAKADSKTSAERKQPVLVELFTSEGCSSCPPADRLAIRLQSQKNGGRDVIILSEHVDYWNHLGWEDRFSSAQFTDRQRTYAQVLGQNSVYTPEAVVDGTYGVVGSEPRALGQAIDKCTNVPKVHVNLSSQIDKTDSLKRQVTISADCPSDLSGKRAQLYLVISEDNLKSNVHSGENGGATLEHTGVVRRLEKVSTVITLEPNKNRSYTADVKLDPQWKRDDLRIGAFLQDPTTQTIWGVNQIRLQ